MRAHTTWLSDAEKDLVYGEALVVLERVGLRMAGSQRLAELREAGAAVERRHGRRAVPGRARRRASPPLPARCRPGRRGARERRRAARRGTVALLALGLRRADAGPPHRAAPSLDARRPARGDHRPGRDTRARRAMDDRDGQRRAPRRAREARVLHGAHRDGQARDLRRLSQRHRAGARDRQGALRQPRRVPAPAPHQHAVHGRLAAVARRRPARLPREPCRLRHAGRDLHGADLRSHGPGHAGRHRGPGPGRAARRGGGDAGPEPRSTARSAAPRGPSSTCARRASATARSRAGC